MASGVYKSLTIEFNANTTHLDAALKKSDDQAKNLERELRNVEKAMKLDGNGTATATRKMELLKQSIEQATEKLNILKAAEEQQGANMSTDQWTHLQAAIEQTEGALARYRAEMQKLSVEQAVADSSLGKMGDKLTDIGEKLDPIGQKMQSIGVGLTVGVTAPIVATGTAAVKAAVNIDTALTGVRKTVDGTEEDYQRLKEAAIEFSKTNAVSAEQVLNAQALGAQLGFTIDELDEFAEVATGLELSTDMGLEDAATEMAQFANITGMAHDEISNYASAIVEVGNNMATTESKVSSMAQRIAAAGTQVNMTQAELVGWSGVMSSLGIEAEAGGTAFSTFVSTIDAAVATGGEELEKFAARAGMSAEDFAASWKDSATDTLQVLLKGIAGADNMTLALEDLGVSGIRQTDVLKRLAGNTELVAKGIGLANEGWEKNTALSDEVANKNDSLAAKFEILKNRVIAVMEQIGKPLADALLDVLDAAEPLFDAIENGAKAFADMSEDEQRTVIQTVALVAALGPTLAILGKVVSNVKVLGSALKLLATGFATLDTKTGGSARQISTWNSETGKIEKTAGKASVAMGALKTAAIGLAIAGILVLVDAINQYVEHLQKVNKATNGLEAAMNKLGTDAAVAAFDEMGEAAKSYRDQVDETIEAHARLADEISELYGKTESDAALADHYLQAIKDAQVSFDGSAEAVARLQAAVDGYNQVTGSSLEITDKTTGALSQSTAQLELNTEAWKANARAQAAQQAYQDIFAENFKAHQAEQAALEATEEAWKRVREAQERGASTGEVNNLINQANKIEASYNEVARVADQSDAALAQAEQQMVEYSEASMVAMQSTDDFRNALGYAEEGIANFDAMAERLGTDSDTLAEQLRGAGISSQDMAAMGEDSFAALYQAANGDCTKIAAMLDELDKMGIEPKDMIVTDDGTIEVQTDAVEGLDKIRIDSKTFTVYADDQASWVIDRIKSVLATLSDKVVNIWTQEHAAGGIFDSPVRKWATGGIAGIVAQPTLTSVGLVGEAGAEAIIPLTNRNYVRPFAQAVAAETGFSEGFGELRGMRAKLDEVVAAVNALGQTTGTVYLDGKPVGRAVAPLVDYEFAQSARRRGNA